MTWIVFGLLAPFLFALTNHIDKLLLENFFKNVRASTFLVYSAIASAIVATGVAIFNPHVFTMNLRDAVFMFSAGVIYFLAILPYVKALTRDEASRVVPLFQMLPVMAYIFGVTFFNEVLSFTQVLAGIIILGGAVLINLDLDNNRKFKKTIFGLMALSCLLFMFESAVFKFVGSAHGFWDASFYQYLGTALAGMTMMVLSKGHRRDFAKVTKTGGLKVFLGAIINESIAIGGRLSFNFALLLAPLALVTLLSGTQPIFVLAIGVLLALFIPKYGKESLVRKHLLQKIISVIIIFVGLSILLLNSQ